MLTSRFPRLSPSPLPPAPSSPRFKRQGHFDALRKVLLSQFSTSTLKEPLLKSIESNLLRSLEKDLILKVEDEIHGNQETPVHPSSNSSPSKSRNREKSGSGKWGRGRDNGYGGKGIASGSGSGSGSGSNHQAILGGGLTQEELNKKVQSAAQGIMEIDARLRHAESLKTLEKSQIFEDLVTKLKYNSYLEGESSKEMGEKDQEDSKQTTVKEEGKEESKDQSQREKEENFQVQALLSRKNRIGKSVGESLINVIKSERKRLRREEREERGEGSGSEEEEEDAGNTDEEESESGGEDQEMKVEDDQEEK